jgi:preprotein translocase subunit SecA
MFQSIFGNLNQRKLSRYFDVINKINKLEEKFKVLTDTELQQQTSIFIQKLLQGSTLETVLEEAFAVVREASLRILNLRHFDVQLIGGIILHEGKIAEMKTGEGKTLVAMLPSYVNALTGKGVHVITVNDYLASRDAECIGQVHRFLGLSVGLVQQNMTQKQRQLNYCKDIVYATNTELGFDYLRDNMATSLKEVVQKPFYFSILDEIDSILIDEARTPLIISGSGVAPNSKYKEAELVVQSLKRDLHYELDEKAKNASLTELGLYETETQLKTDDLYSLTDPWAPYIFNALKAKEFFLKDTHYIIKDGEVVIVDEFTGRIMTGRRWSDGLHQAIEAKEGVEINSETQTLASITYQNFFLLYPKLSGMTGTAKTEETELDRIYGLEVICVPTHQKMIRKDFPDLVYKTQYAKWKSIADECLDMHSIGRPVLVGTTSVEKSEFLSSLLTEYNIPHNLLNAKPENVEREAEIISQAGRVGSVTIATNMAGRGTDILLGGNSSDMAKRILKNLITSSNALFDFENSIQEEINNLCTFLKLKLNRLEYNSTEIDKYLSIVSERALADEPHMIVLRSAYRLILEKCQYEISKEKEKVIELGGLHVVGTERHESRRIDNQLRGRSGRQGDPGSSRFFLSLEDNLLRIFSGDKIKQLMDSLQIDENIPIESELLTKSLESAQKKVENYYYEARKQLFEYDEVLNYQRQAIYSERRRILKSQSPKEWIIEYAESLCLNYINEYFERGDLSEKAQNEVIQKIEELLDTSFSIKRDILLTQSTKESKEKLLEYIEIAHQIKEQQINLIEDGFMKELERSLLLQKIDSLWKKHLQDIATLRENIGWRGYGQKDPLLEYKSEAYNLFLTMINKMKYSIVYLIFRSQPVLQQPESV